MQTRSNIVTDLPRREIRLISVTGVDAAAFLQGQLTIDCAGLTPGTGRLAALCSAQGRVVALLRVFRLERGYVLALADESAQGVLEHLQRHRLRARVEIDWLEQTCCLCAATERPTHPVLACLEYPAGLYEYLQPGNPADLDDEAALTWYRLSIAAGVAEILPSTRGLFLPQWINLDLVEAVDFDKGCYLGQEIVARAQHLGQIKRRTLRLACTGRPLPPGTVLRDGEEPLGDVLLSAPTDSGVEMLAVVRLDRLDRLAASVPGLERRALPYRIPELDG